MIDPSIELSDVVAKLAAELAPSVRVGSVTERGYMQDYSRVWPAVWVGGQRGDATDQGDRFTSVIRQRVRVLLAVRVVVARAAPGVIDAEAALKDLAKDVNGRTKETGLLGWTPPGADQPLSLLSFVDDLTGESVFSRLLTYQTTVTWQK
jgi:hypothetical protein